MTNITSKITAIEKVLKKEKDESYKNSVIIAYKRDGVNYYEGDDGIERKVDELEDLHKRVVILPLLNGMSTTPHGHKADFVMNYNEYPYPHN